MAGGYQQPTNPAPVSGPGAMSQRTDGGPTDTQAPMVAPGGAYGERSDMLDLQSSAPMEAAPAIPPASPVTPVPFTEGSQRPNEPLTAGVDVGPGPGSEILGGKPKLNNLTEVLRTMVSNDTTGEVAAFLDLAQRNGW